jgi:tetratricopeptide (TPR) repeat protein
LGGYELQLLGPFRLTDPGGRRVPVSSKRGMALIAMLAMSLEGERSRGWLQEKLWGARQDAQARGSLRRELSELRKLLNPGGSDADAILITERDRVRLDLTRVRVDALIAEDLADQGGAHGRSADDFLEGLRLVGEEGFQDWRRERRLALRSRLRSPAAEPAAAKAASPERLEPITSRRRPVLAVTPFETAASLAEEEGFARSLARELATALARSRLIMIRSTGATRLATRPSTAQLCAELGADYLIQGHVRRDGETLKTLVTLDCAREDRAVWSSRHEQALDANGAGLERLVAAVAGRIEPALLDHEATRSLSGDHPPDDAWSLFLRGRWRFWRAKAEDFESALDLLRGAHDLNPRDVPTLTLMALCCLGQVWTGVVADPHAHIQRAYGYAMSAVGLDPGDAYAHSVLGVVLSMMGRVDQALAEQRLALDLNPYLPAAAGEMGRLSLYANQLEEAIAWSDAAISEGPNDPHAFLWFRTKALARFITGHYDEAAAHAADACARSPHQFFLHYMLAACRSAAGDLEAARLALAEGRRLLPVYSFDMMRLGLPLADAALVERYARALRRVGWSG